MGRQCGDQTSLFYAFRLDDRIPKDHLLRRIDVFVTPVLDKVREGEGFAVDASVMEANASRYHGKAPDEIAWAEPERQTRAVKEYLDSLEAENEANPNRKAPKLSHPATRARPGRPKRTNAFSLVMASTISSTLRTQ